MPSDNNTVLSDLVLEVEALKRNKQDKIAAGGNSMLLARGSTDGVLTDLHRTDAIDKCHPDIQNVPSETAVVAYVEGQSQSTLAQARKLVNNATSSVEKKINDEVTRATAAEAALQATIATIDTDSIKKMVLDETNRATKEEDYLKSKINDEKDRASTAETNLSAALHEEISRASDAEGKLAYAIADESARAKEAEVDISKRVTASDEKIVTLRNDLRSETERAKAAEKNVSDRISEAVDTLRHADDQLLTALNTEITRASGAEASLQTKITAEVERATAEEKRIERIVSGIDYDEKINALKEHVLVHEQVVDQRVSDEVDRAIDAESALRTMITDEITRSTRADDAVTAAIADETNRAKAAEEKINESLRAEITRSLSRDDTLDGKISNEVERATRVEHEIYIELGNIGDRINDHDAEYDKKLDDIKAVVDSVTGADATLDKKINDEITRATAAEATITANLSSEINRAKAAEEAIHDELVDEIARSREEDSKVYGVIDEEVRRAKAAETKLDEEIAHERTRALAAEELLNNKITGITDGKVDKNIVGEDGTIVNSLDITLQDSSLGDRGAKQILLNKRLVSLMTGATQDFQETYDLSLISGSHAVREDLALETQRAQDAEAAMQTTIQDTIQFMKDNSIKKDVFKNNDYKVMSSQEIHTEEDAYGSDFWVRTISKNVQDETADITQEVHVKTSDALDVTITKLDQNDYLLNVDVQVPSQQDISDMIKSILGVDI